MHWVVSVEIYVIFARGFYAAFVSLSLLSDVACGLLFGSKVLEDAGSGFVHRINLARGYLCVFSYCMFRCVSCYDSRLICGKFAGFHLLEGCANFIGC